MLSSLCEASVLVYAMPPRAFGLASALQGRLAGKEGDMQLELASRVAQVGAGWGVRRVVACLLASLLAPAM